MNLVSIHDQNNNPLSPECALLCLIEQISKLNLRDLLQNLGEIAQHLYWKGLDEGNRLLIIKYLSQEDLLDHLPILQSDGTKNYLFTLDTVRLLSNLVVFKLGSKRIILDGQTILVQDKLHVPQFKKGLQFSIANIFMLTNQMIVDFQTDVSLSEKEYLEYVPIYYSKQEGDPLASIGRGVLLYDTDYFNDQLENLLGITVRELFEYIFILFSHVNTHLPAKIEPEISFRRINNNDRSKIKKILDLLSSKVESETVQYSQIQPILREMYLLDTANRGKPFLKIENRFVCTRPDLLTSAFVDFSYYYISDSKPDKKDHFFEKYGEAFAQYIIKISQRSVRDKSTTYLYKKKPHRGNPSADLHLEIDKDTRVLIEIKGAREIDEVRKGSKEALKDKFIHLGGTAKKPKGVFQVIKDAKKFRDDFPFSGEIFTIVIFSGRFPETSDFDDLVKKETGESLEHKKYLENGKNFPTIWLNASTAELFFSALIQGLEPKELLKSLAYGSPSQNRIKIINCLTKNNKRISLAPLFTDELEQLSCKCKKMFSTSY